MTDFISRDGKPMTLTEWATAYEDRAIRQVALDMDKPTRTGVSTIWEGIVAIHGQAVFETVIIRDGIIDWDTAVRSCTEEEALAAHQRLLELLQGENHG